MARSVALAIARRLETVTDRFEVGSAQVVPGRVYQTSINHDGSTAKESYTSHKVLRRQGHAPRRPAGIPQFSPLNTVELDPSPGSTYRYPEIGIVPLGHSRASITCVLCRYSVVFASWLWQVTRLHSRLTGLLGTLTSCRDSLEEFPSTCG